jgi:hypothetical protein
MAGHMLAAMIECAKSNSKFVVVVPHLVDGGLYILYSNNMVLVVDHDKIKV